MDNDEQNNTAGGTTSLYLVNGRAFVAIGEALLLDRRGEGLVLLVGGWDELEEKEPRLATATVFRPDLARRVRVAEDTGRPVVELQTTAFAAETFAVMPLDVAAEVYDRDLLLALTGGPCGECPACRAAAEGGADEEGLK